MVTDRAERDYLARMEDGIHAACEVARGFVKATFHVIDEGGNNVVTEADHKINQVLRKTLLGPCEGWLSEDDPDNTDRLRRNVVWIVDALDGTREFVDGIPEWCVSVGLVVGGVAFAGAVCNPFRSELFIGSRNSGVTYNKKPVRVGVRTSLDGALVLASRQEYLRGEWRNFENRSFSIRPTGSIAYKLALVSAGLADATWTLTPKHEWDFAGGVALLQAAGGRVHCIGNQATRLNRRDPLCAGLIASSDCLWPEVRCLLRESISRFP
jgi:myo-inositol-1(or 4)-monophosphatase